MIDRRSLVVSGSAFSLAMLLTPFAVHSRTFGPTGTEAILLGAGSRLSMLVVDGASRVLIAAGDDGAALTRALARISLRSIRVDVAVLSGNREDDAVAAWITDVIRPTRIVVLSSRTIGLMNAGDARLGQLVLGDVTIRLGDDVTISTRSAASSSADNPIHWSLDVAASSTLLRFDATSSPPLGPATDIQFLVESHGTRARNARSTAERRFVPRRSPVVEDAEPPDEVATTSVDPGGALRLPLT